MGRNMLKTADFRGFLGVFLFVFIGFSRFLGCRHGRFTVGVDRELASEVRNETASLAAQYLATCRRYFEPLRADFEPFLIIFPRVFHAFFMFLVGICVRHREFEDLEAGKSKGLRCT